jgi:RNA polymerase sigma-70 factor (ECF subfamily)
MLAEVSPTPVVELNRAVAVAMADGPEPALAELERLGLGETLATYQPYHAARADLLRRAGRRAEAADAYRRAIELTGNVAERGFLEGRLRELGGEARRPAEARPHPPSPSPDCAGEGEVR